MTKAFEEGYESFHHYSQANPYKYSDDKKNWMFWQEGWDFAWMESISADRPSAEKQGLEAYDHGLTLDDNPYAFGVRRKQWRSGWLESSGEGE